MFTIFATLAAQHSHRRIRLLIGLIILVAIIWLVVRLIRRHADKA